MENKYLLKIAAVVKPVAQGIGSVLRKAYGFANNEFGKATGSGYKSLAGKYGIKDSFFGTKIPNITNRTNARKVIGDSIKSRARRGSLSKNEAISQLKNLRKDTAAHTPLHYDQIAARITSGGMLAGGVYAGNKVLNKAMEIKNRNQDPYAQYYQQ